MERNGISLVALVITIIVLIILTAGVIMLAGGENGIIGRAQRAVEENNKATATEKVLLEINNIKTEVATIGQTVSQYLYDTTVEGDTTKGAIRRAKLEGKGITISATPPTGQELVFTVGDYSVTTDLNGNILSTVLTSSTLETPESEGWNGTIETPILGANMTGIYWDETAENAETEITGENDTNWYNYVAQEAGIDGTSKWANAKTEDGSYWVWIPRFEYKITDRAEGAPDTAAGTIDVRFISKETTTASEGYIIHPAFRNKRSVPGQTEDYTNGEWDKELAGIWVAKYEMTGSSVETMKSVPGVPSWAWINIANCYNYAYEYNRTLESHLMKNSEWGAVAYLTHSQYGRNAVEEVEINEYGTYTGGSEGATATTNVKQSSTGNATGVYDLNGGAYEYTAAYNTAYTTNLTLCYYGGLNGNSDPDYKPSNGEAHFAYTMQEAGGISSKYVTAYTSTSDTLSASNCKIGDAIYEIGKGSTTGWYSDTLEYISTISPFFNRGGLCVEGDMAGVFYSFSHDGGAYDEYTFRVVLAL